MDTDTSQHLVNVLLTSFAGLGLPRTLSLPTPANTPISQILTSISDRLPAVDYPLQITTTSSKSLHLDDASTISDLLPEPSCTILPLRLSARTHGGKGGFGSQLRAAGGRMSSRKNRNANQNPNGSNRNLDGRRLRVIDSAKDLARHLATKPEMSAREREEKRKRWESVVEAAEKKSEEIRSGTAGRDKGRLDANFVEGKDMAEEKMREAVLRNMREAGPSTARTGSESSVEREEGHSGDEVMEGSSGTSEEEEEFGGDEPTFYGWDDDDDDDDHNDDDDENGGEEIKGHHEKQAEDPPTFKGKGKEIAQ